MKFAFIVAAAVALLVAGCDGGLPQVGGQSVEVKTNDRIKGQANAPVTIIEYASMTCPHCAAWAKDVYPQLNKEYIETGKARLIFREFPLDTIATMASTVARCFEGDQYFAFVDLLFANQMNWMKDQDGNNQLTREDIIEGLAQMARQAGMPREKVAMCADDMTNFAAVEANWQEAQTRYNVNSTPTFIINGTTYAGGMSFEQLKEIIDPLAGG